MVNNFSKISDDLLFKSGNYLSNRFQQYTFHQDGIM